MAETDGNAKREKFNSRYLDSTYMIYFRRCMSRIHRSSNAQRIEVWSGGSRCGQFNRVIAGSQIHYQGDRLPDFKRAGRRERDRADSGAVHADTQRAIRG